MLSAVKLKFDAKGVVVKWLFEIADEAVLISHNHVMTLRKKAEAIARMRKREVEAHKAVELGDGRRCSRKGSPTVPLTN